MKKNLTVVSEKNKTIDRAERYAKNLSKTRGSKNCSEIARTVGISHDKVQRDLKAAVECADDIRSKLFSMVYSANKKTPGFIIGDNTLLVKEFAKSTEGVSKQHHGSDLERGIGLVGIVWTNLEHTYALNCFTWQQGDPSKIETGTQKIIVASQRVGALGAINDAAFITENSVAQYQAAFVAFLMRFHSNRVVFVPGFDSQGEMPIRKHPAFKMNRNQRYIIKKIIWRGLIMHAIAIKINHPKKGATRLFLVTTLGIKNAKIIAGLYTHRWKIESFFRKCKQTLGLGDCLSRSLKKQEAHCLAVFLAYNLNYAHIPQKIYRPLHAASSIAPVPVAKIKRYLIPLHRSDRIFHATA